MLATFPNGVTRISPSALNGLFPVCTQNPRSSSFVGCNKQVSFLYSFLPMIFPRFQSQRGQWRPSSFVVVVSSSQPPQLEVMRSRFRPTSRPPELRAPSPLDPLTSSSFPRTGLHLFFALYAKGVGRQLLLFSPPRLVKAGFPRSGRMRCCISGCTPPPLRFPPLWSRHGLFGPSLFEGCLREIYIFCSALRKLLGTDIGFFGLLSGSFFFPLPP